MKISELHIYPVKSLAGIALQEAELSPKGLKWDRNWMLLDENGLFMTQRDHPHMALINTKIEGERLHFEHDGNQASIPILEKYGDSLETKVWSTTCEVEKVDSIGEWFSGIFGFKCQLVFLPKNNNRKKGDVDRIVSLADKSPFLITNNASLRELNSRLSQDVPMNRFRANIIVDGNNAYQEDHWTSIKITDVQFDAVEICGRCKLINVNHKTAQTSMEPLKTLSTYRKMDREIKFGVRMSCKLASDDNRTIRVGDEVVNLS